MITERGRFLHSERARRGTRQHQRPFKLGEVRQGGKECESEHMPVLVLSCRGSVEKIERPEMVSLIPMSNSPTIQPICRFRLQENERLVGNPGISICLLFCLYTLRPPNEQVAFDGGVPPMAESVGVSNCEIALKGAMIDHTKLRD